MFQLSIDVAVDLGTANTLVYIKGKGIVVDEPSIVAVDRVTRKPIAVGGKALVMHGRTNPQIETVRPLKDGVIADFEVAEQLIRGLIRKVQKGWMTSIRQMVVCIPSGITEVEKRAVRDSAEHSGAKRVHLIQEPMAAAIGIGLDVKEAIGSMVVDIGGGTTEIAVITLNGISVDKSIRTGGSNMDEAIKQHFSSNHNLIIGDRTAEQLKMEIGSAVKLNPELRADVKGRDKTSGLPVVRPVSSNSVYQALTSTLDHIVDAVVRCLEQTPPELGVDVLERGIMLTGGGALLKGLDEKIRDRVEVPVNVAEEPLTAVVRGTGKVLENVDEYREVLV